MSGNQSQKDHMTKSEQAVYDRVKEQNDAGRAHYGSPVTQVGGQKSNWRGRGYKPSHPSKHEQAAFDRLLERGDILQLQGRNSYVVKDHPVLQTIAAEIDLFYFARHAEQKRLELESAEKALAKAQDFVRTYGYGQR
jgi:hypothetical protein